MKKLFFVLGLMSLMVLASCSKKTKEIKVSKAEFTTGSLSEIVQLGDVATATLGDNKIEVTVEVRNISPRDEYTQAQPAEIVIENTPALKVDLQDKDGGTVATLDLNEQGQQALMELLRNTKGTETLTFVFNGDNTKDAFSKCEQLAGGEASNGHGCMLYGKRVWTGTIAGQPVRGYLDITKEYLQGRYAYKRFGITDNNPRKWLYWYSPNKERTFSIAEINYNEFNSANTDLHWDGERLTGGFTNEYGNYYTVDMRPTLESIESIDFYMAESVIRRFSNDVSYEFGSYAGGYNSSASDIADLLRSYEKYVDSYVKLANKAANGDATALLEYPELLQNANELQHKLENVKGQMSAADLARFARITSRMASVAK